MLRVFCQIYNTKIKKGQLFRDWNRQLAFGAAALFFAARGLELGLLEHNQTLRLSFANRHRIENAVTATALASRILPVPRLNSHNWARRVGEAIFLSHDDRTARPLRLHVPATTRPRLTRLLRARTCDGYQLQQVSRDGPCRSSLSPTLLSP